MYRIRVPICIDGKKCYNELYTAEKVTFFHLRALVREKMNLVTDAEYTKLYETLRTLELVSDTSIRTRGQTDHYLASDPWIGNVTVSVCYVDVLE